MNDNTNLDSLHAQVELHIGDVDMAELAAAYQAVIARQETEAAYADLATMVADEVMARRKG